MVWGSLLPRYEPPSAEALAKVSLAAYWKILSYPWLPNALKNTLILVLATPTLAVFLASVSAWVIVRTRLPGRRILDTLTFLPQGIPGVVLAMAFLWLYLRLRFIPIYGTIWIIVLCIATRHLAYSSRAMNAAMIQLHKELEEASQVSGATWLTTFFRITIPLLLPTVISTWIWSAIVCVRELSMAVMLYSPSTRVLSVLIWDLWLGGLVDYTCAIGVMLVIFLGVLLFVGRVAATRRARQY